MSVGSFEPPIKDTRLEQLDVISETQDSSELMLLTPGEQQLAEAVNNFFSEEVLSAWHEEFNEVIHDELHSCIDENDREIIAKVASIIEWHWFGKIGELLPEGVGIGNDGLEFFDSALESRKSSVKQYLFDGPLHDLAHQRNLWIKLLDHNLYPALDQIAKEQPIYQLLHAVVAESPQPQSLPLTVYERIVRQAQEDDYIRQKYDVPRDQEVSITLQHDAFTERARRLYRIDEEKTHKAVVAGGAYSTQRLLDYVTNILSTYGCFEKRIVDLTRDSLDLLIGQTENGEEIPLEDIYHLCADFVRDLGGRRVGKELEFIIDSEGLLERLADRLSIKNNRSLSGLYLLEHEPASRDAEEVFSTFTHGAKKGSESVRDIEPRLLAYLRGIDAPILKPRSNLSLVEWSKPVSLPKISVIDRESFDRLEDVTIGNVEYENDHSSAIRLVIERAQDLRDFPSYVDDYDMCLRVYDSFYMDEMITVPGYQLVAFHQNKWYFIHTEHDPYDGANDLIVDQDRKDALEDWCRQLGLTHLATYIKNTVDLNVATLVEAIKETSEYTFNQEYGINRRDGVFTDQDFVNLVDPHGFLQVQCTGAAAFLNQILKSIFPEASVKVLTGHAINSDGSINVVQHDQVLLVIKDRQYILDATPPIRNYWGIVANSRKPLEHKPRQNLNFKPAVPNDSSIADTSIVATTTTAEFVAMQEPRTQNILRRTNTLLKAHFDLSANTPDEHLYKHLSSLKQADPLRRVLQIVLRAKSDTINEPEIDEVQTYIVAVLSADDRAIQRIGIPRYDQILLNSLSTILDDLRIKAARPALQ